MIPQRLIHLYNEKMYVDFIKYSSKLIRLLFPASLPEFPPASDFSSGFRVQFLTNVAKLNQWVGWRGQRSPQGQRALRPEERTELRLLRIVYSDSPTIKEKLHRLKKYKTATQRARRAAGTRTEVCLHAGETCTFSPPTARARPAGL